MERFENHTKDLSREKVVLTYHLLPVRALIAELTIGHPYEHQPIVVICFVAQDLKTFQTIQLRASKAALVDVNRSSCYER